MESLKKIIQPHQVHLLDTVPLIFRNFNPEDFRSVCALGKLEYLDAGYRLSGRQDSQAMEGYLIIDGQIDARRDGFTIERYERGDFIGESLLHSRVHLKCELIVTESSEVLVFDRDILMSFFRDRPEKLLKIFTMNVVDTQQRHINSLYNRITKLMVLQEANQ